VRGVISGLRSVKYPRCFTADEELIQSKKVLSLFEDPMDFYRSRKVLVIGLFGLSLIVAAAIAVRARAGSVANASFAHRDLEHPPYVAVPRAKRVTIANSLSIAGQFMPYQNVDLHAKVAGYIRQINVDIGDRVHKAHCLPIPRFLEQFPDLVDGIGRAVDQLLVLIPQTLGGARVYNLSRVAVVGKLDPCGFPQTGDNGSLLGRR
jgi:hypothetical protein